MWINRLNHDYSRAKAATRLLRIAFLIALTLGITLSSVPAFAQPVAELAVEGDQAYKNGDYEKAIDVYNRLFAAGYESGILHYNLGNAYFKHGDLARAILEFERAEKLMPHNRDVRYNLRLANERIADRIEKQPRLPIWNWLDSLRDALAPRIISTGALFFAILAAALFVVAMLAKSRAVRKGFRIAGWSTTAIFVCMFLLVMLRIADDRSDPGAIVMVNRISAYAAPDGSATEVFSLHAGTKVLILKELDQWREVRLEDGRQGWLPAKSMEKI